MNINMNLLRKESPAGQIDKKIVDNIRGLSIDIIDNAKGGHPGIALGAAPIIATLYSNHLKIIPENPDWFNRDRFIMSAGHWSALLYSVLFMAGYNIDIDDLKSFRKIASITPGHPEYRVTPGVDMSTGPLGQGIATAVGIAMGEQYLSNYFGKELADYHTYVLCSDGDLMEGVSYEALSLAGKMELNKLIVLYDSNGVTLDGRVSDVLNENTKMRFESINWNYILVSDGEDTASINDAINKAKNSDKPTLIEIKTTIGKYSFEQGTSKVHGTPLQEEDIKNIKQSLNLRDIPFAVSFDAVNMFRDAIKQRNEGLYDKWLSSCEKLDDVKKEELISLLNINKEIKLKDIYYDMPEDGMESTRVSSGKILNSIANNYPFIMGGSADVANSTFSYLKEEKAFNSANRSSRNINYGIREHGMACINNGLALTGITSFASTFLAFSDYMKPAIRMSCLMNLPSIYVFTHDSVLVGEDGPTHQPVEQLTMLRATPGLDVYRPYDANEVLGSYKNILETRNPSAIVLSRNKVKISSETKVNEVKKGAYIIGEERGELEAILISCGEELAIAKEIYDLLKERGIALRLVSMPSMELFERQPNKYKESVLPSGVPIFVLELASSLPWYKYTNNKEHLFTIEEFGVSGSKDDILNKFGISSNVIADKIEKLLK